MNESYQGWVESVMPHYDLRTVIYEVRYKKTRTESKCDDFISFRARHVEEHSPLHFHGEILRSSDEIFAM
ncbi:hypothetical protein PFISCL1PPCAC_6493, partial [Pristionchus fissidentatus]